LAIPCELNDEIAFKVDIENNLIATTGIYMRDLGAVRRTQSFVLGVLVVIEDDLLIQ
jgi:hypothetical protein